MWKPEENMSYAKVIIIPEFIYHAQLLFTKKKLNSKSESSDRRKIKIARFIVGKQT